MDNFFELFFWLIAIAIWISSAAAKKKRTPPIPQVPRGGQEPVQNRKPPSLEERILESFGFKIPEALKPQREPIPERKPSLQSSAQVIIKNKREQMASLQLSIDQLKLKKEAILPVPATEAKAGPYEFIPLDKLEQGIILSVILGPPKAYTFQPGWWNGRHVGLKNR